MQYFPPDRSYASLPELYSAALNVIQDSVVCDGISIFELSDDGGSLEVAATRTFDRDLLEGLELDAGTGIAGRAAVEGRGEIANRVQSDPDFFARADRQLHFETRSVLCCPMRHRGRTVGVIELVNKVGGKGFETSELDSAQAVADAAAANWGTGGPATRVGPGRDVFYELTRMLRKVVDVEGISVFTLDEDAAKLRLRFCDTAHRTRLESVKLAVGEGVAGAAASERRSLLVPDVRQEPRFFRGADEASRFSTRSIVAVPVPDGERLLAVLELVNARGSEPFTERDRGVLVEIAAELAVRLRRLADATAP